MSDPRKELQGLFHEAARYGNFGEILLRMTVQGFRCHTKTLVEFQSPITAVCGLNGTGKSTLLQLAASGYRGHHQWERHYVSRFIMCGQLDLDSIRPDARVSYEYLQPAGTTPGQRSKTVTVSRARVKWTGYTRQPVRKVLYAGVGYCIPRVEERDVVTIYAHKLQIVTSSDISEQSRQQIGRILGTAYAESKTHDVTAIGRPRKLMSVGRDTSRYSEINMGFGEGRICRLIAEIDALPEKSLILLEEPEISLHPSAQHEFGKYLVELCVAKRHQVILSTHSEYLLEALPQASRIYLHRVTGGIATIPGISVRQAASLLAAQKRFSLQILVEDDVAEHIVVELLRRHDPIMLKTVRVVRIGSKQDIQTVMRGLTGMSISACAVRDGDAGANPKENLFKLPGVLPPEKAIFQSAAFRTMLAEKFGIRIEDLELQLAAKDHHDWFSELADMIPFNPNALLQISAEAYLSSVPEAERTSLIEQIKSAVK